MTVSLGSWSLKLAAVLSVLLLLQLLWGAGRLLLLSEPAPVYPAQASLQAAVKSDSKLATEQADEGAMVERPLFWEGRKAYTPQPTIPQEVSEASKGPSKVIDQVKLLGVFGGANPGIIISLKGDRRRLQLEDSVGDWTFTMMSADGAVFESGTVTRIVKLEHAVPLAAKKPTNGRPRQAQRTKIDEKGRPSDEGSQSVADKNE
jgi:hypothetical protein